MPRNVMLVTGPSRSADIEQTLELGAHGPRRLHVVLIEDDPAARQLRAKSASSAPDRAVQRPGAGAGSGEVEEDEAVQDRALAAVQHREEAARRVRHEVADRHLAGEQEGDRPGEQAEQDQQPAADLEHRREPEQAERRRDRERRRQPGS